MRNLHSWLVEYRESHRHPVNQLIHKICVPLITLSTLGLLWAIPVPSAFQEYALLNWSTLFAALCIGYYISLSPVDALGMAAVCAFNFFLISVLDGAGILLSTSIVLFVISWVVQIYGHKIEGEKPSFMKNAAFFLIGPLWVNRSLFWGQADP